MPSSPIYTRCFRHRIPCNYLDQPLCQSVNIRQAVLRLGVRHYATKHDDENRSTKARALPSDEEAQRSSFSKGLTSRMDNMQAVIFNAGQRLNDLTGYSGIEAMKRAIEEQEENVRNSRLHVQKANEDYKSAVNQRSSSQKEMNDLLQRKHSWTSGDLERFTTLYRSDHASEQAEIAAHARVEAAEKEADAARVLLSKTILTRYHEEQIWSDKIRRASTWGTWGLMGFNIFLFVIVQLGLEPWKRRRLVGNFEEKVRTAIAEEREKRHMLDMNSAGRSEGQHGSPIDYVDSPDHTMEISDKGALHTDLDDISTQEASDQHEFQPKPSNDENDILPRVEMEIVKGNIYNNGLSTGTSPNSLHSIKKRMVSLFNEDKTTLRNLDLTIIALEGVACGVVATISIISLLSRNH